MTLAVATCYLVIERLRPCLNASYRVFFVAMCTVTMLLLVVVAYASMRQIEKISKSALDLDTLYKLWLRFEFALVLSRVRAIAAYCEQYVKSFVYVFYYYIVAYFFRG